MSEPPPLPRLPLYGSLLAVYLIWGSTYLGIRYAIETLPGLTMAGLRYTIAGSLLFAWGFAVERARPRREHWLPALGIGLLLMVLGHGGVVWAQHRVASGLTALVIATEPLWVALLATLRKQGPALGGRTVIGLLLGLLGVALLVWRPGGAERVVDPLGAAVLVGAACAWAFGSLYAATAPQPRSPQLANGMALVLGGILLALAGGVRGEWAVVDPSKFSTRSLVAFGYLVVFGSLIAYTAYGWLVRNAPPALASTYAFVNPLVALALGAMVAGEPLGPRVFAAAALIVPAVVAIVFAPTRARTPSPARRSRRRPLPPD